MLKINSTQKNLVIMTGGKSSRMGSDKSSLPFGNQSVIEYIIAQCKNEFDQIFISVADHEQASRYALSDVKFIYDQIKDCGPIGGLYSVLKMTEVQEFFVCAVDIPFFNPLLLKKLEPDQKDSITYQVAKHSNDRTEPLFGWYSRQIESVIYEMVEEHNYRLHDLLRRSNGHFYEFNKNEISEWDFYNMNDRNSYYKALVHLNVLKENESTEKQIPIISFAGWSGTGKTTYIEQLLPHLIKKNLRVAVIKHDGHEFEMDRPGKDTYRFYHAGAEKVLISSKTKLALIENHVNVEADLETLCGRIKNVDLIIVEGYKYGSQPKIEIHRSDVCTDLMDNIPNKIAIISDVPLKAKIPVFDYNKFDLVVDFIIDHIIKKI